MTFRIRARSNIKDSMTFLIAEPPLRRADQERCQGPPPTQTHPPDICTASEGIKLTSVHHGFPRARALGGSSPGDSLPADGAKQDGRQQPSRWSPQASRRGPEPDPRALPASRGQDDGVHRHSAPRHQACQRWQPVKEGAGSRSRARRGAKGASTARPCSYGLSQAAVHSRAAGSGCSIQPDLQDGRIRPWDDSRSPPRCSSRSAFGLCLGRSG